jgi:predicted 2-oxoglutarate/Fe(II)-dependent dioxygenase YbiX
MHRQDLYDQDIFVVRQFLSPEECDRHIAQAERLDFQAASVASALGPLEVKDVRDNDRVIFDDAELAAELWVRARPYVPAALADVLGRRCESVGLNERFRCYCYDTGQRFAPHANGRFKREGGDESRLTWMVYLNDDFSGGETIFYLYEDMLSVRPERGMALAFVHEYVHEGATVAAGRKYVLRTDVMYRPLR